MALVTMPGAEDADSYATADEFSAYHTARGNTFASSPVSAIESALRRATAYLDNQYRGKWKGYRTNQTQALAWPRTGSGDNRSVRNGLLVAVGVVDLDGFEIPVDEVPTQVKNAAIEAALLTLNGVTLEPRFERGGRIKSIGKSVGPLRKDITYMDGASVFDRYTAIEGLLRGLVTGTPGAGSGNVRLVRA